MSWIDALKATLSVPPGYSYEPHGNRYRDVTNGQWVPFRAIYNVLNANQDHSAEVLSNLCVALKSGEIDLQAWFVTMEAQLRILHVQNAALGAGGFSSLQPIDFMRIDSVLRDEVNRLEKFGNAIVNSGITQGQIDVRCAMYAGTARKEFYKARKLPALDYGQVAIERRVLGVAEHCSWCTYLNDLGWQMAGILPVPGESSATWDGDQCLSKCKCDLERKIVTFAQAEEMIRTPVSSVKAWDESAHPRHAAGSEDGGQFAPKEMGSGESSSQSMLGAAEIRSRFADIKTKYGKRIAKLQPQYDDLYKENSEAMRNYLESNDPTEKDRMSDCLHRILELDRHVSEITQKMNSAAHKLMFVDDPIKLRLDNKYTISSQAIISATETAFDFLRKIFLLPISESVMYVAEGKGRSFYHPSEGIISIGTASETASIHEMGHWLEHVAPGLQDKAVAFLDRRTEGEEAISMREATGNQNYHTSEKTKKDHFIDPYIGKVYADASGKRTGTEIISMGLEHLYRDPIGFAEKDPDMFDFVLNTLRGN